MSYYSDRAAYQQHSGIQNISKNRMMITNFGGIYNKRTAAPNEARDDLNITTAEYPAISTVGNRGYLRFKAGEEYVKHITPGKITDAVSVDGNIIIATENGVVIKDNKYISCSTDEGIAKIKQIIPMGKRLYCLPCGVLIDDDKVTQTRIKVTGKFRVSLYDHDNKVLIYAKGSKTAPSDPELGELWFDDTEGFMKSWAGAFWMIVDRRSNYIIQMGSKPEHGYDGLYWADNQSGGFYRYNTTKNDYVAYSAYRIAISNVEGDLLKDFSRGDGIVIGGEVGELAGDYTIADKPGNGVIVVNGLLSAEQIREYDMTIERRLPVIDFAVEYNNRVWGCRYGENDKGEFVNEIYCSKLGDPLNFFSFSGNVDDSFIASIGAAGKWTGAAVLNNKVIFFKEDCYFTVSGDTAADFYVYKTDAEGVQAGCERSVVRINGSIYYKAQKGIMMLSANSLPVKISDALGADKWHNGRAGTDGRKYYIQMTGNDEELFCYDTAFNIWHREKDIDDLIMFLPFKSGCIALCSYEGMQVWKKRIERRIYPHTKPVDVPNIVAGFIYENITEIDRYGYFNYKSDADINIWIDEVNDFLMSQGFGNMSASKAKEYSCVEIPLMYYENDFVYLDIKRTKDQAVPTGELLADSETNKWHETGTVTTEVKKAEREQFCYQTGLFGLDVPDGKIVESLQIRAFVGDGAELRVDIMYNDNDVWIPLSQTSEEGTHTFRFKEQLKNCDSYRLNIYGYGEVVIFSVAVGYVNGGTV